MAEPFLAEIKIVSFNFNPRGWAMCNGQLLPINQNQALFSLLGTTYGGDGRVNFALPDLRARTPLHMGSGYTLGQRAGEINHTLTINELPTHNHTLVFSNAPATIDTPGPMVVPARTGTSSYAPVGGTVAMAANSLANVGGSQPHMNQQPLLTLNFIIALQGIYPSQN